MVTVRNIYDFLDEIAPFSFQQNWDNSGLLIGNIDSSVERVGIVLDVNNQTLQQAISLDIQLIISHHPVIFKPQKQFLSGNIPYELAVNNISCISSHTCLDSSIGGVNDVLANLLELERIERLDDENEELSLIRVGFTPKTSAEDFAEFVSEQLSCNVRFCNGGKMIETVAVCGGSGGDFISPVALAGIDALVTGDAGHHAFVDAKDMSLTLIAAGHFETENPTIPILAQKLRTKFSEIDFFVLSQENPINHIWKE